MMMPTVRATQVRFVGEILYVALSDGREVGLSLRKIKWLKWLAQATPQERRCWAIEPLGDAMQEFRERRQRLPKALPDEVVQQLIQAAASVQDAAPRPSRDEKLQKSHDIERAALRQARDLALLHALRASGMRVGELVGLKRGDLDYRTKSARVIGKGNKERVVFFDESCPG